MDPRIKPAESGILSQEFGDCRLLVHTAFADESGRLSGRRIGLLVIFVFLQLLDLGLTQLGLSMGITEINGLASGVIASAGGLGLAFFKLAATFVVVLSIALLSVRYRKIWAAIYIADVLMTLVVAFNVFNIWLELAA